MTGLYVDLVTENKEVTNLTHQKKRMFHVIDNIRTEINKSENVKVIQEEESKHVDCMIVKAYIISIYNQSIFHHIL